MLIYTNTFTTGGRNDYPTFDVDGGESFFVNNLNFVEVLKAMELSMSEVDSIDLTPLDYNGIYNFSIDEEKEVFIKLNDYFNEDEIKWIIEGYYGLPFEAGLLEESYMTVAEMIRALQEMPQDAKVIFTGSIDYHRGTTQCGDFGAPSITLEDYHTYEDEENNEVVKIEGPLVKIALYSDATYRG